MAHLLTRGPFPMEVGPLQHDELDVGDRTPVRCFEERPNRPKALHELTHRDASTIIQKSDTRGSTRVRLTFAFALAVTLAVDVHPALVQTSGSSEVRSEALRNWIAAVEGHEFLAIDTTVISASVWSARELQDLLLDVSMLVQLMHTPDDSKALRPKLSKGVRRTSVRLSEADIRTFRELALDFPHRDDGNRLVKRGALLHADVAMLMTRQTGGSAQSPDSLMMEMSDGRHAGFQASSAHWEFARALLDLVMPTPSRDEMVRLWYRATIAYLQQRHELQVSHIERARQLFADDSEILFQAGCLHETFAGPRVQNLVRSAAVPRGFRLPVAKSDAELRKAENLFRRALALDARLTEGRLRLGRVLGLQGRHAEAVRELRQVVTATDDPVLQYYAGLFLGAAEEELGRTDAARTAYQRSATLYPKAQSPHLALDHLARRRGDRQDSGRAILRVLKPAGNAGEPSDPWWMYHVAHGRHAEALLNELRRMSLVAEGR